MQRLVKGAIQLSNGHGILQLAMMRVCPYKETHPRGSLLQQIFIGGVKIRKPREFLVRLDKVV